MESLVIPARGIEARKGKEKQMNFLKQYELIANRMISVGHPVPGSMLAVYSDWGAAMDADPHTVEALAAWRDAGFPGRSSREREALSAAGHAANARLSPDAVATLRGLPEVIQFFHDLPRLQAEADDRRVAAFQDAWGDSCPPREDILAQDRKVHPRYGSSLHRSRLVGEHGIIRF